MTSSTGPRRVLRLRARGGSFADAWAGKSVPLHGAGVLDGDLAVISEREPGEGVPGAAVAEVVGRCRGGAFHPTYRTRGI